MNSTVKEVMAGYVRLSKEDEGKGQESESVTNQRALLESYAKERDWEIYNIYVDEDYSGVDSKRPAFNQLLSDAEKGKFNTVVCKSQSRFTRDIEVVEKYIHSKFQLWGIRFISITDNADTAVKGNKKARQINSLINEWYLEDLSENVRTVLDHKRVSGSYIGAFAPYGYEKDPENKGHLIPDPVAAGVVRKIFSLCLQGYGKKEIAKRLNQEHIPSPSAYKMERYSNYFNPKSPSANQWNPVSVVRILQDRVYIGDLVQGKVKKLSYKSPKLVAMPKESWIVVPGTHEAIVSKETFQAVQHVREMRNYKGNGGIGKAHVLAGKIRCAGCGGAMSKYQMTYKGKTTYYLRCKLYSNHRERCTSHSIRLDILEKTVWECLHRHISHYFVLHPPETYIKESPSIQSGKAVKKQIDSLEIKLKQMQEAKRQAYTDKVAGILSAEDYVDFSSGYTNEIEHIRTQIEALQNKVQQPEDEEQRLRKIQSKLEDSMNFQVLNRQLVCSFVDCVEIGEKDPETKQQPIRIVWMF